MDSAALQSSMAATPASLVSAASSTRPVPTHGPGISFNYEQLPRNKQKTIFFLAPYHMFDPPGMFQPCSLSATSPRALKKWKAQTSQGHWPRLARLLVTLRPLKSEPKPMDPIHGSMNHYEAIFYHGSTNFGWICDSMMSPNFRTWSNLAKKLAMLLQQSSFVGLGLFCKYISMGTSFCVCFQDHHNHNQTFAQVLTTFTVEVSNMHRSAFINKNENQTSSTKKMWHFSLSHVNNRTHI